MATYTESNLPLEFLISEAPGDLSVEAVTLAAGSGDLKAGRVLAKVTATGKYVPYDDASATAGVAVADAILAYPTANSASDQTVTVVERLATVKSSMLDWGSQTAPQIAAGIADLLAKNIKART